VNPTIYDSLTTELNQHVIDLEQDGYIPSVISSSFNSAESLRAFLKQKYDQDTLNPLKGAVFVGNMPFTKFQTKSYSAPDSIYQCFPCETFFGDVDGTWLDNKRAVVVNDTWRLIPGQDSIYDTHIAGQGDKETEIFLGRLDASNMVMGNSIFGNEIQRLRDYFQRLHSYWEGNLARDTTALVYFDDDWANPIIVNSARDKAQMVYSNTITISDSNTTAAQNYKQVQLPHGYEFMWLAAHSNPAAQMFKENNGTSWGYVDNFEIPGINPQSLFYLFNCCNLLDFSVENIYNDFMANQYIFSSNKGLALIGYTARAPPPIGATYDSLWAKLASHKSFGEGLEAHIDEYINRNWTYNSESYATAIIGVPTVKLHRQYQPGIEEPEQVVREINDKRIKIYPTVFKDKVIVKYSNGFEEELEKRLDIYSIDGRKVKDIDLSNYIGRYNSGNIPIDLSDLNKGVYFARIGNNARDVEKIVKQ
jgi:hypothetical protein